MCPSAKKKPKNGVVSKMEDEKVQDKIKQPVHKAIERNRLKMVLRNLSLLKLFKSSNSRIQELHNLARRCWNSMIRFPKIFRVSSGESSVCNTVKQNNEKFQEAPCLEKNLECKKVESTGEPKEDPEISSTEKDSPATVPRKKEQTEPALPRASKGHGLNTGAQGRHPATRGPPVVLSKTYSYRTPMGDMRQLDVNGQYTWFEGLPTRIHLPGPRVLCRASQLRRVKRRCTRFCSASLEVPMYRSYKSCHLPLEHHHNSPNPEFQPEFLEIPFPVEPLALFWHAQQYSSP
ncbi:TP53-target gene 5 protein isoform X1 [Fukomys damarensis]|uniref:TP53-target gene 5 protein isoform X1 n=1 Tax=Fukomys damarensis TaxID=885580 RepID=UPI00053FF6A6|nr:TP53-target gene 5 protein isoform X1 [Fukomys damarensis]